MKEFAQEVVDVVPPVTPASPPYVEGLFKRVDIGPETSVIEALFRTKNKGNQGHMYLEIVYHKKNIEFWWRYTNKEGVPFSNFACGPFLSLPACKSHMMKYLHLDNNQLERMA